MCIKFIVDTPVFLFLYACLVAMVLNGWLGMEWIEKKEGERKRGKWGGKWASLWVAKGNTVEKGCYYYSYKRKPKPLWVQYKFDQKMRR